jgi:hypothetical protein
MDFKRRRLFESSGNLIKEVLSQKDEIALKSILYVILDS